MLKIFLITFIGACLFAYTLVLFKPPFDTDLHKRLIKSSSTAVLGGCGFEALYIKQHLDCKGIPSSIVVFGKVPNHVMVLSNGCYIDKHGFFGMIHPIAYIYKPYSISLDSLQRLCNRPEVWNKKFNRADTILLKQFFNQ